MLNNSVRGAASGAVSRESSVNAHPIDPGEGNSRSSCQQRSDVAQGKGELKDFSQEGPKRVGSPRQKAILNVTSS